VTEQTAEFIFGSWSAPQVPAAIEYPLEVMDEIRAAVTDGLQKLARGGLEVAGVLFGVRRETGIRILTWRPIGCEYALGPTLQLSERDRADLTRLLETAAADPDLQGLKPVGWFLSHTRSDIQLSPADLEIFNGFFPHRWQVTLVLHPTPAGPARAGFFIREADGTLKSDSSYQEFDVKPLRRTARPPDLPPSVAVEPPSPRTQPVSNPSAPMATAVEGPAAHMDLPLFRTLEPTRTPRGWLWMLPVILGLIVAGFLVKERYLAPQNQPFSLHVYDSGETVQIEWNQNAAPIRNSHIGVIDIKDSGETKRYSLTDEELRAGKMPYLRRGGDLELRMTVYPVGSTAVQEFAHFLDPGPAAPAPNPAPVPAPPAPSEIDQLRQERDRLDTQVKKLKEDLRKERSRRGRFR
jgi:hypothetical protein